MVAGLSLVDREAVVRAVAGTWLAPLAAELYENSVQLLEQRSHGDRQKWLDAIVRLPRIPVTSVFFDQDMVQCVSAETISAEETDLLSRHLMTLHPWRKGPFNLFGIEVDSEWRSNWKWNRIQNQISPLLNRTILDVGCGNGYYLYRMLGQGARLALGIDPTQLFLAQFSALQSYLSADRAIVLPMKGEDFLSDTRFDKMEGFDTVFSMGIYYHRKEPEVHLHELHRLLKPQGELVLETLVISGEEDAELDIPGRYAQMRNVWSIPTVTGLHKRLGSAGFDKVRLIDLTPTTTSEQRSTSWMHFDSLEHFLNPMDHEKTIEGHPAPLRATLVASKTRVAE